MSVLFVAKLTTKPSNKKTKKWSVSNVGEQEKECEEQGAIISLLKHVLKT